MMINIMKILHLSILTIVVVARDSDSYAGQPCGEDAGRTVHVDVTGLTRCCKEVNCSKGTVGQMCSTQDPASTKCVACPKNYFMKTASKSSDMLQCSAMKKCSQNRGLTVKVNGTAVSNNVCQCDVKLGYWDPNKELDPIECSFVKCDRGYELTGEGCKPCRQSMFKTTKGIEMCSYWTNCQALGLDYAMGGNTTYNPGCINETTGHGSQTHPGVTETNPVITGEKNTKGRKGGLAVGIIITIAMVVVFVIIVTVALLCRWRRRQYTDEKPTLPPCNVEMVSTSGTYEPLTVPRPDSQDGHGVGGDYPSQTYPKQPYDSNPTTPTYHEYDEGHRNGAAGSSNWSYKPVTKDDSQTCLKQLCDSNLPSPTSHTYEVIDDDGVMGNKGGDVEEDAAPATPDENPARSSITVTTGDRVINITGEVVNLQVGKNNKMVID